MFCIGREAKKKKVRLENSELVVAAQTMHITFCVGNEDEQKR